EAQLRGADAPALRIALVADGAVHAQRASDAAHGNGVGEAGVVGLAGTAGAAAAGATGGVADADGSDAGLPRVGAIVGAIEAELAPRAAALGAGTRLALIALVAAGVRAARPVAAASAELAALPRRAGPVAAGVVGDTAPRA